MPPDHIVFQMLSTLDLSAPVIMTSPSILPFHKPTPLRPPPPQPVFMQQRPIEGYETPGRMTVGRHAARGQTVPGSRQQRPIDYYTSYLSVQ